MGVDKSWLWNVKLTDAEAREVLRDPADPRFLMYAARRLATANLPREIFRNYLTREHFLLRWPAIKRQMRKDSRNRGRVIFWQGVYEYLIKELKEKGTPFVRPKKEARVDPEQKKDGDALRALRLSRKMTQAELAEKAGLTQQHIAKIEKGITQPRLGTLQKIQKALGASNPHEYPVDDTLSQAYRIAEPGLHPPSTIRHPAVTTWFTPDPGLRTESK